MDARLARRERISQARTEKAALPAPPPRLQESQMLQEAQRFLASKGQTAASGVQVKEALRKNPELRREFLNHEAQSDVNRGTITLGIFANTLQRSRWIHTTQDGSKQKINGPEVGRDVGMVFAGTDEMMDGPKSRFDNRWNINKTNPSGALAPTGFRESLLNDDGSATEDQTHHLAFYTMVGATHDNIFGTMIGYAGAWWSDRKHPQDILLGKLGVDFGRKLDDPKFDPHSWLWRNIGNPSTLDLAGLGGAVDHTSHS